MKNIYYIFLLTLLVCACGRESMDTIDQTIIINPPNEEVIGSLTGVVYDDDGPVAGAMVFMGSESKTTDAEGLFSFIDTEVFKDGTYVQVEKDGYLSGSRKFFALEGTLHQLRIHLNKKTQATILEPNAGGMVSSGSASVTLPEGVYQKGGLTHNGQVHVYAKWLDPTNEEIFYEMPGNLTGISKNGTTKVLTTFGMMRVELEDSEGNKIEMPEGKTAMLHFPVPAIMDQYKPEFVSLWHFDKTSGTWVEEVEGVQLMGDHYVVEVSHFSYWNLSLGLDKSVISGIIKLGNNIAANREYVIRDLESGYLARGFTTGSGEFSETVPEGNELLVEIPTTTCNNEPYAKNFPGYKTDQSELEWQIETVAEEITIEGTAVDCGGNVIPFAMIRLQMGNVNNIYRADAQGYFKMDSLSPCESFSIYTIDPVNSFISERHAIQAPDFNLNEIITCNSSDIKFNLSYSSMDWKRALEERGVHSWDISRLGDESILIAATIQVDGKTLMEGVFKFNLSESVGDYVMTITSDTEHFEIGGQFNVEVDDSVADYKRYTLSDINDEITTLNNSTTNLGSVIFELVYLD